MEEKVYIVEGMSRMVMDAFWAACSLTYCVQVAVCAYFWRETKQIILEKYYLDIYTYIANFNMDLVK